MQHTKTFLSYSPWVSIEQAGKNGQLSVSPEKGLDYTSKASTFPAATLRVWLLSSLHLGTDRQEVTILQWPFSGAPSPLACSRDRTKPPANLPVSKSQWASAFFRPLGMTDSKATVLKSVWSKWECSHLPQGLFPTQHTVSREFTLSAAHWEEKELDHTSSLPHLSSFC